MPENRRSVDGPELAPTPAEASWRPKGSPGRVAVAHRQAWPTLRVAVAFVMAAAVVAVVGGAPRQWMALHLLLLGGVLSAISAATQMFAITWSAATPPPTVLVAIQRWLLAIGAVVLVAGRELELGTPVVVSGGVAVLAALLLLAHLLWRIRTRVAVGRHLATIDGYLVAVSLGIVGSSLGAAMAVRPSHHAAPMLDAHTTVNLFGMVGLVVAATVPSFVATQARTKMSSRYRADRARVLVGTMAGGVLLAAVGILQDSTWLAVAGLVVVLGAMGGTAALLPPLGVRQWRWAGPRLLQVMAALAWWVIAVLWALVAVIDPAASLQRVWPALAVGGIAQLVIGSLAYLGPIIRGREHRGQQRAFVITRSWLSLVAGNVAAIAVAAGWPTLAGVAIAAWVVDTVVRAGLLVVLVHPRSVPLPSPG